jgi:hypothetical protein
MDRIAGKRDGWIGSTDLHPPLDDFGSPMTQEHFSSPFDRERRVDQPAAPVSPTIDDEGNDVLGWFRSIVEADSHSYFAYLWPDLPRRSAELLVMAKSEDIAGALRELRRSVDESELLGQSTMASRRIAILQAIETAGSQGIGGGIE